MCVHVCVYVCVHMKVCFPVYFYVAVIKHWQKKPSGEKGLFWLTAHSLS